MSQQFYLITEGWVTKGDIYFTVSKSCEYLFLQKLTCESIYTATC